MYQERGNIILASSVSPVINDDDFFSLQIAIFQINLCIFVRREGGKREGQEEGPVRWSQ